MGNNMGITGCSPFMERQYKAGAQDNEKSGGFDDLLRSEEEKGGRRKRLQSGPAGESSGQSAEAESETVQDEDYRRQLQEKMAEMLENIKHGTIQPKFRIGAQEYTHEEWNKLLEKVDAAEEDARKQLAAEFEEAKAEREQEKEKLS